MFEVRIRLFANLKEVAGGSILTLKFEQPPTPNEIITSLILKAPELKKYLLKDGSFNNRYKFLNGSEEIPKEKFTEPIRLNEISILPPVSGG